MVLDIYVCTKWADGRNSDMPEPEFSHAVQVVSQIDIFGRMRMIQKSCRNTALMSLSALSLCQSEIIKEKEKY